MKFKVLLVVGLVLLFASAALAATPTLDNLGVITDKQANFDPTYVALGSDGSAYVADHFNRAVKLYDYKGKFVKKVNTTYPYGIAVDASGMVYVSTKDGGAGEVKVYDKGLAYQYSIGAGQLQFPAGVAVDASRLYVADASASVINAYDIKTKQLLFSFGAANGVQNPTGVAVSPATGDVYVIDRALFTYSDGSGLGSSGKIFSRDGAFKSMFFYNGSNDTSASAIISPAGIAIDAAGNVFVSDGLGGALHIYDAAGSANGTFSMASVSGVSSTNSMAIGADGRLLAGVFGKIQVLGINNYTLMNVTPAELDFSALACSNNTSEQSVVIGNTGKGTLNWTISSDAAWIVPAATSGMTASMGASSVGVSLNTSGLSAGDHSGTLTVSGPGVSSTVAVKVTVTATSTLDVAPQAVSLEVKGASVTQSGTLNVTMSGDASGQSSWTATPGAAWISVTPSTGLSNAKTIAQVSVVTSALSGMAAGTYNSSITISTGCNENAPVVVPVTLNYIVGGTLSVTSNLSAAKYTVSGPGGIRSGSGASSMFALADGTYTVTFKRVPGYKTPSTVSKSMTDGASLSVVGNYSNLRQSANIITSMGSGACTGSEAVNAFDVNGKLLASYNVADTCGGASTIAGVATAAGDVNGDAIADLIVANMGAARNEISAYDANGSSLVSNFIAFSGSKPASVASGDVNGDGAAEVIVGSGSTGTVRIISASTGTAADAGSFTAASTTSGINVAVGDVDGDGKLEIVTVVAGGSQTNAQATIWKVTGGVATKAGVVNLGTTYAGTALAVADVNGDGVDEIIAATVTSKTSGKALVQVVTAAGAKLSSFQVDSGAAGVNVSIAAGDLNSDANAEIAVGQIAAKSAPAVRVYTAKGALLKTFTSYSSSTINGTKVSIGKVAAQ